MQEDQRNTTEPETDSPNSDLVSCNYWMASLGQLSTKYFGKKENNCNPAFILLPHLLSVILKIVWIIKDKEDLGDALAGFLLMFFYPLTVPLYSVFWSVQELLRGKNKGEGLNTLRGWMLFELLGRILT